MKTERICISKKTLIVSMIILFLLGVVWVSYLVQSKLTLRSKASEMDVPKYSDCRRAFEEIAGPLLLKNGTYTSQEKFVDNYVGNQEADAPVLTSCPLGQDYPYAITVASKNCCLNKKSQGVRGMANGVPVEDGLTSIGLKYIPPGTAEFIPPVPFKSVSADSNTGITVSNQSRCIDFGDNCDKCAEKYDMAGFKDEAECKSSCEKGPDDAPWISPHMTFYCGIGDGAPGYIEKNSDGAATEKYVRVECGDPPGTTANRSCTFNCRKSDGKTWERCEKVEWQAKPVSTTLPPQTVKPTVVVTKECKDIGINHCWIIDTDLGGSGRIYENMYIKTVVDGKYRKVSKDAAGNWEDCLKIPVAGGDKPLPGICAANTPSK